MNLLRKLLDNLGDKWNKSAKEFPFLSIKKGNGLHSMITIDLGVIYFHSAPYRPGLPGKQSIVMKGLDADDLLRLIRSMGYEVEYSPEHDDYPDTGILALLEVKDQPLDTVLYAFTSGTWQLLYPIYRALRQANMDIDEALSQLNRDMAKGDWLDYWASFFAIQRNPGETDNNFIRRFTMWLFNPKTNNIALKELLSYRLQDTNIEVRDKAPAEFELTVDTKYIEDSSDLHEILLEAKGAGIRYFLNYISPGFAEDYRAHFQNIRGQNFSESDELSGSIKAIFKETIQKPTESFSAEATYQEIYRLPSASFDGSFRLSISQLGAGRLGDEYTAYQDVVTISLIKDGQTIYENEY
ncbi:hypothetical protein [Paenibacillus shenyangensis]|uniref:hypothetical protein n=1 Tax=Paenibacillus sp. A9 TaxID=1284352 RepID=UPI0003624EDA|nr:hypothetical protein [Paenibacillus sp. A9]